MLAKLHSTTVIAVLKDGSVAVAGDGQVTLGSTVLKGSARKVRRLYHDSVVAGFAGASADAFTLFEEFERRLQEYRGSLYRAAVGLAKEWRMDRNLRRLEAMLIAGDRSGILLISGSGDVVEPDDGIAAIGSGGPYALAAARALSRFGPSLDATTIARQSLLIASEICIYTNGSIVVESLG